MPDVTEPDPLQPNDSTLEKLIEQAEQTNDTHLSNISSLGYQNSVEQAEINRAQDAVSVPCERQPKPCVHTDYKPLGIVCRVCLWPFCPDCASPLDPTYCHLCLNEPDAQLKELPLVDKHGDRHEGRVLQPAPGSVYSPPRFMTLTKSISEMSNNELADYIQHYKDLVRQAEIGLDFRRVVLGAASLEQSQRQDAERRKLRADKKKYPVKTVSLDPKTGKPVMKTASASKVADMIKMIQMLQALKAKKG